MPTLANSYVKKGHTYYKYAGRYHEVTTASKGLGDNDASKAIKQKQLVTKGTKSAASTTLTKAWAQLNFR
jgi:galactokinase